MEAGHVLPCAAHCAGVGGVRVHDGLEVGPVLVQADVEVDLGRRLLLAGEGGAVHLAHDDVAEGHAGVVDAGRLHGHEVVPRDAGGDVPVRAHDEAGVENVLARGEHLHARLHVAEGRRQDHHEGPIVIEAHVDLVPVHLLCDERKRRAFTTLETATSKASSKEEGGVQDVVGRRFAPRPGVFAALPHFAPRASPVFRPSAPPPRLSLLTLPMDL